MIDDSQNRATDQIRAAYSKAVRMHEDGRFAEAVQIYMAILKRHETAEPSYQIGRIAAMTGRKPEAATWFRRALKVKPKQTEIWQALIAVLDGKERTAAVNEARRLGLVQPESTTRQFDAAIEEIEAGRLKKAARLFSDAIKNGADALDARWRWANALLDHEHATEALAVANDGLKSHPNDPRLRQLRARIHEMLGHLDDAEADLLSVLDTQPYNALAWNGLMRLRKQPVDAPHVARLEGLIEHVAGDPQAVRSMSFALAKGLEDQGRYDQAFKHLERGNRMTAERFPYPSKDHYNLVRGLIASWKPLIDGFDGAAPIFVVGLPRSGTSLVETILGRHSQVAVAGETQVMMQVLQRVLQDWCNDGTEYDARALGQAYVAGVAKEMSTQLSRLRTTDKSMLTYMYLGYVRNLLPNARFVLLERDRRDVGLSIYKNLFQDGTHGYANDLGTIAEHIRLFDAAIEAWSRRLPGEIHVVQYEALTENPEPEIRALLDHCELDWDPACLSPEQSDRKIATLSSVQVRRPINRSSVEGWKRYGAHLDPLIEALETIRFDFQ